MFHHQHQPYRLAQNPQPSDAPSAPVLHTRELPHATTQVPHEMERQYRGNHYGDRYKDDEDVGSPPFKPAPTMPPPDIIHAFNDGWCDAPPIPSAGIPAPPTVPTRSDEPAAPCGERPTPPQFSTEPHHSASGVPISPRHFSGFGRMSPQNLQLLHENPLLDSVTTSDAPGNDALSSCFIKLKAHWNERRTSAFHCQPRRPCSEAQLRGYQELELDPEYVESTRRRRENPPSIHARTVRLSRVPSCVHPKSVLAFFASFGPVMSMATWFPPGRCSGDYPVTCEFAQPASAQLFLQRRLYYAGAHRGMEAEQANEAIHSPNYVPATITSTPRHGDGNDPIHTISSPATTTVAHMMSHRSPSIPDDALDLVRCTWYWEVIETIESELYQFLETPLVLSDTMNYATASRFPTIFRAIRHTHAGSAQLCDGKQCQKGRQSLPQSIASFLLWHSREDGSLLVYVPPRERNISEFISNYLKKTRPRCLSNDFFLSREDGDATPITPGAMVLATVPSEPFCALGSEWTQQRHTFCPWSCP